jgi:TRAP-type mannitol/chloroaromatic compound transport system permease large subunit
VIFQGAFLFLLANVFVLALIVLFPQLVLWIPSMMME